MKCYFLSEDDLIQKALDGSLVHLNLLISWYEPLILESIKKQVKNRHDLLDLRQRVCCKIAEHIAQKSYTHQDKFPNWVGRIIKSEINTHFRKKKQNTVQYFSPEVIDGYTTTDEPLSAAEDSFVLTPNVLNYINQLSPKQAVVIKLKYYENKTFREIAKMENVSINTIMGRYRYAIGKIREMMAKGMKTKD